MGCYAKINLNAEGRAYHCLNIMGQVLLTLHRRTYLLGGVYGGCAGGGETRRAKGGDGGRLGFECKIEFKNTNI